MQPHDLSGMPVDDVKRVLGAPELSRHERGLPDAPTAEPPRDCEHGYLFRKRIGLCPHCTEAELLRVEAERDALRAVVEAGAKVDMSRETDIATVRTANHFLRHLLERSLRHEESLTAEVAALRAASAVPAATDEPFLSEVQR